MSIATVGFIGGGRIVRIFLEGWSRANKLPTNVLVAEPSRDTREKLKARFPAVEVTDDLKAAAAQDIVFLATPPPTVPQVADVTRGALRGSTVLVSLAPKFTVAQLTSLLGGFTRIARANPNAPSIVGAGYNPIHFAPALTADDRAGVSALFAPLGDNPEVAEEKIEAYAIFTAMGPTYLWFQLQALRELAVSFGLTDEESNIGLERMASGAARTLVDPRLTSAEVMDLVPVKPLVEMEPQVLELYRTRLPALFRQIKPEPSIHAVPNAPKTLTVAS